MLMKNPIITLIKTGWAYAGNRRHLIVIYLVMFALAQAIALAEPYVIGKLLNCLQTSLTGPNAAAAREHTLHQVYGYLGIMFLVQIGFWAFHGPGRLIERNVAYHIKADYKSHMFRMVTELPLQWHREHHSGDSIDKINKAALAVALFFDSTFEVSYMIFRLIGTQIILFWFMPAAGAVALIASAVAVSAILLFDRVLYKNYKQLNRFDNHVASGVHDYVTNVISIITLRLEGRVLDEVRRRLFAALSLFRSTNTINEIKWCSTTVIISLMIVSVMAWYAHNTILAGTALMSGTFFTLFEYLRRIGDSFYNFAFLYGTTVQQAADVESAQPLFDSYKNAVLSCADHPMPPDWKQIEVRDLYFTYADEKQREHHLENISVLLEKGKSIAFVGESGSGKSTLLNLLRGMQSADRAVVVCDGQQLPQGLSHLASVTTLLPQDPEIFADTIKFNINFGIDSSSDALDHATGLARFEPVLARLPLGLGTNIAEKGVNLSGGEKQRLALARGIFFARESDIVLLDEPTSSVDPHNERIIYSNIMKEFPNKCIISSVHKLNLLDLFDYIYVFDDGRIIEEGDLQTLLSGSGKLASLWRKHVHSQAQNHETAQPIVTAQSEAAAVELGA